MQEEQPILSVKDTNMEALKAKSSAIKKGYLVDPFVKLIVRKEVKKDIIINRGYWSRTYAIQSFQRRLLKNLGTGDKNKRQIISLGCGYDTFVFNLFSEAKGSGYFKYFETDLKEVVQKKVHMIDTIPGLNQAFIGEKLDQLNSSFIKSENYALFDADLTNLEHLESQLELAGVDPSLLTYVFAECVLVYIEEESVRNLLKYLKQKFPLLIIVDYEMQNPNDAFGQMMVSNFHDNGCDLAGINFFNSISDIEKNYRAIFEKPGSESTDENSQEFKFDILDMNKATTQCIDVEELNRILKLEFLDEYEEFVLMQSHYFVSMAKFVNHEKLQQAGTMELEDQSQDPENRLISALEVFNNFSIRTEK